MVVYCLFCETQKAPTIAGILEKRVTCRAFSPQIIRRQRVKGENLEKLYQLLPGYVFVYSEQELNPTKDLRGIAGIVRRLGRPEDRFVLSGTDLEFAMNLYQKDGLVGRIPVYKAGDKILIEDELFNGCRGVITQMDYKKQRARVEFKFAGTTCHTWIACDLIEKKE